LSDFVGIPPPEFRGRRMYKENGMEKWEIQTVIRGHEEDPKDLTMDYTNTYIDWSGSVVIAMQGAIAHICYKYRHSFSSTTPYYSYVSNVSIIFDAPCLFYTICFMFCLHFVAFLCDFQN
jgi:hypothetical protein